MGRRRRGDPTINGWLVIDKPSGLTSSRVVGRVRAITGAAKAGHGGTLDPLATGVLPIALGEATKTVSQILGGTETYRFTVRWGEARDTDDAEGAVTATSDARPDAASIRAALPAFTGVISQVPPVYSAIKIDGRRAYDLARGNQAPRLDAREVRIDHLTLDECPSVEEANFEMRCGSGTYVRSLARDLARHLGTCGHVTALRRTASGPFTEADAISLDKLKEVVHSARPAAYLLPVETALADIPALAMTDQEADLLRSGQSVPVSGAAVRDQVIGLAYAQANGRLVALTRVDDGVVRPVRVFNL